MLKKQYKAIQKETKNLDKVIVKLQKIIFEMLSIDGKDIDICIDGECFKIINPMSYEEKDELDDTKCKIITLILRDAMDTYFDEKSDQEVWKNVYALAQGSDPKDHQFKKSSKANLVTAPDSGIETESGHIALPMDENSYQVKEARKPNEIDPLDPTFEEIMDMDFSDPEQSTKTLLDQYNRKKHMQETFDAQAQKELMNDKAYPEDKR